MTATITLKVLKSGGLDTRLMFPGLLAVTPEGPGGFGNLGTYTYSMNDKHFELTAVGTFYPGRPYASDLSGVVTGMGLNRVVGSDENYRDIALASLSFSLDSASSGPGGVQINSFLQLTPDGLLNPIAALTDVRFNIIGAKGNDKLFGSDYDDFLNGARGRDLLTGYGGADTFFFNRAGKADLDHVVDFKHRVDTIQIDDTALTGLQNEDLSKAFHDITKGGMKSEQADDRLLYDRDSGKLYYDQDGSKTHHRPEVIAIFDNHAHLGVGDFDISF